MNTKNTNTMRNKTQKEITLKKWLNFLNEAKTILDGGSTVRISQLTYKHKITNSWQTFLTRNGIIEKNELDNWVWNQKIPVSSAMVNQFRKYQYDINTYSKTEKTSKPAQQELDLLIEATKPKKKPAIKINAKNLKTYSPYQEKQVGLIRKFLRWIY